jgi:hypothetical protein
LGGKRVGLVRCYEAQSPKVVSPPADYNRGAAYYDQGDLDRAMGLAIVGRSRRMMSKGVSESGRFRLSFSYFMG